MTETLYDFQHVEGGVPIKMWTRGVPVEDGARAQLARAAQMPFVFKHVAAMPDVHVGIGATVGSVIPTKGAIIPAAVGVDIGCGMMAARTSLMAHDLPDNLEGIRAATRARGATPRRISSKRGPRSPRGSSGSPTNTRSSRRRTTSSISARWAPATTLSSCASIRRRGCG